MNPNFPRGSGPYQERVLAAFKGLTARVVAENREEMRKVLTDQWWQMFYDLIATEDEQVN